MTVKLRNGTWRNGRNDGVAGNAVPSHRSNPIEILELGNPYQ